MTTSCSLRGNDYFLFIKRQQGKIALLLVYVDDLVITGDINELITELKKMLNSYFKMKDLGELKYFLGIEVLKSKEGILLNQRKYALQLIKDTGLEEAKSTTTLLEQILKLTTLDYDKIVQQDNEDEYNLVEKSAYQRLIGRLIYLTYTRLDITYAVNFLSEFMQQPKRSHIEAALRVVKYVKKEPGQGILLKSSSSCQISAYCDLDWGSCPMTRKSVTSFCIKIGDSLVSWKSNK
ncbi:uncharacterized mitochondrial protein AtMg00810-like [Hibiscus syriacus]|uniref:uncharacterized mitochondrial protein AtMg00810-like n=1 Tax=Hibiscus syriacus TaxID=106335 RepID=UPI001922A569|nr:uncharacterized mitochondrial protein AtMg00810-like [Hibiscus syriacus]